MLPMDVRGQPLSPAALTILILAWVRSTERVGNAHSLLLLSWWNSPHPTQQSILLHISTQNSLMFSFFNLLLHVLGSCSNLFLDFYEFSFSWIIHFPVPFCSFYMDCSIFLNLRICEQWDFHMGLMYLSSISFSVVFLSSRHQLHRSFVFIALFHALGPPHIPSDPWELAWISSADQ